MIAEHFCWQTMFALKINQPAISNLLSAASRSMLTQAKAKTLYLLINVTIVGNNFYAPPRDVCFLFAISCLSQLK